jgi:flagellar biosynthesis/type III secretory pathway protein FliH
VTEVLLAARAAADAERAAAKDVAVLLARKMAEKIVGHAVRVDPTVMTDIASQALLASRARGASVVLRVHPEDLAALEQSGPRLLDGEGAPSAVRMVADPSVGRCGCVVETPAGRVDARLATQLDILERVLGGRSG